VNLVCYSTGNTAVIPSTYDQIDAVLPYYITRLVDPADFGIATSQNKSRGSSPENLRRKKKTGTPKSALPDYNCQKYPSYFSTINIKLNASLPVNLTCWTTSPAADKRTSCEDGGAAWFKTADGCYIPDFILMTRVRLGSRLQPAELTDVLRYCPQPAHQVSAIRKQYSSGTYCYNCTSLECGSEPLGPRNGSVELDCWTTGKEVRGDSVWWKWSGSECYVPNQVFDPFAFFGNAQECRT